MTTVSAPGKVLLAGGYLVLDPAYSGIVVSTSSRFYTAVKSGVSPNLIRVKSPQFVGAGWRYTIDVQDDGVVTSTQQETEVFPFTKNKFVELAIHRTLVIATESKGAEHVREALSQGLDIAIVGGNDFYSQRAQLKEKNLAPTLDSLKELTPFAHLGVPIEKVHKTGMGSSAALITSLVGALLLHLQVVSTSDFSSPDETEGRKLAHNVAQYVHCLAQGKVGSGFDVASAIFGSHVYTRFDPAVLAPIMQDSIAGTQLLPVLSPSNSAWTHKVRPFKLPPHTRLLLADVDAGSDTPSMAGKVLKWRKENEAEALEHWTRLNKANTQLAELLSALCKKGRVDQESYAKALKSMVGIAAAEWHNIDEKHPAVKEVIYEFYKAHLISENVRHEMKKMGELSGVPIEPDEQTRLLDASVKLPGVIGGGVPGAGGYDAIWLLVVETGDANTTSPIRAIETLWQKWEELNVSPLLSKESLERGIRVEDYFEIVGLQDAVSRGPA